MNYDEDSTARKIPIDSIRHHVPDVVQEQDATCGASSLLSVCRYFGVGPRYEPCIVHDMGMNVDEGSDPPELIRAVKKYGLQYREIKSGMSDVKLRTCLNKGWPVMLMIQAWGPHIRHYNRRWRFGHWVVAIGFDKQGFYFEDPVIKKYRGYLTSEELSHRWHDYGVDFKKTKRYGLAIKGKQVCEREDWFGKYQLIE